MINRRSTRFRYVNRWKCLANKASSVRLKNHWPTKQVHVEPESRYFFFPIVPRSLHLILRIAGYHLSLLIFLPTRILSLAFNTGIMKRTFEKERETLSRLATRAEKLVSPRNSNSPFFRFLFLEEIEIGPLSFHLIPQSAHCSNPSDTFAFNALHRFPRSSPSNWLS